MRRSLSILVLITFATLGLSVPSSAATVGLSVAPSVALVNGCKDVPITYSVPAAPSWDLKIKVTAADGEVKDSDWLSEGSNLESGTITTSVCDYSTGPGRYTVTATYEAYNSSYDLIDTGSSVRTFDVTRARSSTSLKISKKRVSLNDIVTIRSVSKASGQRLKYEDVVVYLKRPGKKWKVLTRSTTNDAGKFTTPAQAKFRGTARLKVCTSTGTWFAKSCSPVRKLRITR